MNKKIFFLKTLLLIAGYGIIALAYNFFHSEEISDPEKFMWINILILYTVFEGFILFSRKGSGFVDRNFTTLLMGYITGIIFEVAGIILTILVVKQTVTIKTAVLTETIIFFFILMFLLWALIGNIKIQEVSSSQKKEYSSVKELRSSMQRLSISVEGLPDTLKTEKDAVKKLAEEMNYLSPVASDESEEMEAQMLMCVKRISLAVNDIMNGSDATNFKSNISSLELLLKQRKTLLR